MAFSNIALDAAASEAILGIDQHLANLKVIAHDFTPTPGIKYAGVAIPVIDLSAATEFDEDNNNYCNTESVGGVVVTLDKHLKSSIGITDVEAGEAEVNIMRDGTRAITNALATGVQKYVFGLLNSTNCPLSAEFEGDSKAAFADLFAVASDNGLDPYRCTLVLNPAYFAKLLGTQDALIYGGSEAVQTGVVPRIYGFKAVETTPYLPDGTIGAIIQEDSFGIASRLDKPALAGYPVDFVAQGDDNIAIQFRGFENLCKGKMVLAGSVLVGAKVLNSAGIVRLVEPAG